MTTPNIIADFLARLAAQRSHDMEAYKAPPEPEWAKAEPTRYALEWGESTLNEHPPPRPLDEVRAAISREILDYADEEDSRLLLVRVPPGTGKTTAAVRVAQELAEYGRVLYAGPRHSFFGDVMGTRDIDGPLWYEWLPYAHQEDGCYTMCRYAPEMVAWLNRGYPSIEFCRAVCQYDQHIKHCPYRLQAKRKEPIIYGMHQHLITGMSIANYWIGFCDEMPLTAFLKRQHIPAKGINVSGASGALKELLEALEYLASRAAKPLWGPGLFRMIGNTLGDVYAEQEILGDRLPLIPLVNEPGEVYDTDYWYVQDLLLALSSEYECWRNEWPAWISRVRLSRDGLLMLSRHRAKEKWSRDCPLVCLDATGSEKMYEAIFDREVRLFAPTVERPGRIFQVVGRLNGMGGTLEGTEEKRLSKKGLQMLEAARLIASEYQGKRVAIVTFKAAEQEFEQCFDKGNVRHFGDVRGTNDLETADALIVAGGFCPNIGGILDLAASVYPERMDPFVEKGQPPPWSRKLCEYRLREPDPRGAPLRDVSGFWRDAHLRVILGELRRNEITQAMHRARPNLKPSDVWLLTSIPTDEPLDGIYSTLSDLPFTPDRVTRQTKTGQTYYEGITWEKWMLLREWLDRQWGAGVEYISKEMLAEVAGAGPATVAQQKWIAYLADFTQSHGSKQWARFHVRVCSEDRQLTWVLCPVKD